MSKKLKIFQQARLLDSQNGGWASQTLPATALALLIVSVFWHARLGLQVLVEDYVHDAGTKFGTLALLNLATIGGGAFGLVSIARLALGGAA